MPDNLWDDDDILLAELGRALRAEQSPADLIADAKALYTWRTIDAELAALAYDSAAGLEEAGMRGQPAPLRTLTFEARAISLELSIAGGALLGQFVPPQPGTVKVGTTAAVVATVPVDEVGCFAIRPVPAGPFRLQCTTAAGEQVVTSWISV
jgi:hypothetical protein